MSNSTELDKCIDKLENGKLLTEFQVKFICEKVKELLIEEANLQSISSPVTCVGDIHGQFQDLLELFKIGGKIPDTNYLFLGDYVDRGRDSVETISLLTCYKLKYRHRITLLRGNHESRKITQVYGFYTECVSKYGNANVWKHFTDMFDYLAVAALIDNKIFCVHGGISSQFSTLDQIRVQERFKEIPDEGVITDLLWSDPDPTRDGFAYSQRGAGYIFGGDSVKRFLQTNKIEHMVRSHQLCMDGYQLLFSNTFSTIWSAPNYCYRCANLGCILEFDDKLNRFYNTYDAAPNQYGSDVDVTDKNTYSTEYFL